MTIKMILFSHLNLQDICSCNFDTPFNVQKIFQIFKYRIKFFFDEVKALYF